MKGEKRIVLSPFPVKTKNGKERINSGEFVVVDRVDTNKVRFFKGDFKYEVNRGVFFASTQVSATT